MAETDFSARCGHFALIDLRFSAGPPENALGVLTWFVGHFNPGNLYITVMRTFSCVRHFVAIAAFSVRFTFGTLALCLLGTEQALAIPSPELVVGSFASLSQLSSVAERPLYPAGAPARRPGSNISRPRLHRDWPVRPDGRLDRRQHLAIR